MKSLILALAMMTLTTNAFAGAVANELKCKSPSGKTTLEAFGSEGQLELVKLSVRDRDGRGDSSFTYVSAVFAENLPLNGRDLNAEYPGARIRPMTLIERPHLLAVVVLNEGRYAEQQLTLVSKEGTNLRSGRFGLAGKFRATLTAQGPRDEDDFLQNIELECAYSGQI